MKKTLLGMVLILLFLLPAVSHAQTLGEAALLARIRELQQQVTVLLQQLNTLLLQQLEDQMGIATVIDTISGTTVHLPKVVRTSTDRPEGSAEAVLYEVSGINLIAPSSKRLYGLHEDVWDIFVDIAGSDFVSRTLSVFDVYYDLQGDNSAYTEPQNGGWVLGINIADVDLSRETWTRDTVITLIHEYSHMLFAERNEVAKLFEETFWGDDEYEHFAYVWNIQNSDDKQNALYTYYLQNRSRFVSEYATFNPGEDIAESFTRFVIEGKPDGGNEREEKILFFYNYPDVVSIRSSIRRNVGHLLF